MNRETFTCQVIPGAAGAAALWTYMEGASFGMDVSNSLLFAVVGLASYAYGARRAAGDLVKELDTRDRQQDEAELYRRIDVVEDEMYRRMDEIQRELNDEIRDNGKTFIQD